MPRTAAEKRQESLALATSMLAVAAVAGTGSVASIRAKEDYARLRQPSWSPPGSVFGPVWTVLYAMMATAAWLVWREKPRASARPALAAYAAQLGLNALWSPLFFGLGKRGAAFADLVLLWGAATGATALFARRNRLAAALLAPYLVWLAFAGALNWSVWRRNK
ncbi:MAG: TspO/MBR family protein [Segniliparus sp.]|uniref:TspO/MBR family protein n=1 Tax=Segniliparus sp. TaxID=2804064 RepID=UPI003F321A5E